MKKLLAALFALAFALALPVSTAWAAPGDLDEIVDYAITVDVNDDATLNMEYHIEWKVLDSTSEGPLTWVQIGIPNNHCRSFVGLSDTVKDISYSTAGGSYARIDLDRAYHAGEVASFDFSFVQDYMYEVGRDNQGEAVYEFIPGWFDGIVVDNLTVKWNADKVQRIAPAAPLDKGYYTWSTPLGKGERYKVTVGYPDDAFAFDVNKTIVRGVQREIVEPDPMEDVIYFFIGLAMMAVFVGVIVAFFRGLARGVNELFEAGSGFVANQRAGKKITRTKVVYYPSCQGCGAPRAEGKDACEYCGRSLIKSEEVITEEEIPPEEKALKNRKTDGVYAYSSEPNTFLRVHVTPIIVTSHSHGSSHSSSHSRGSGSRGSCACASSCACACACGCACACACAGGGRAGCTTKDFYNTDLKLRQLEP